MRLGRLIVASLAPLLSLSAGVAASSADLSVSEGSHWAGLLLRSVVQLVTPAAEVSAAIAAPARPSAQAVLAFAALAWTPLGHAVWMVAGNAPPSFFPRWQQRALLRC